MVARTIEGFASKAELVAAHVRGRSVLHLGAVGETCESTEVRVSRAADSTHALITREARECVGVDYDRASVETLTDRGIFSNLVLADVTKVRRSEIPLDTIDVVFVGDTIEHLSNPGDLFGVVDRLSDGATKLILTTPNSLGLGIFLANLRGRVLEGADHVCSFNAFTLSNMVERCGWQVDSLLTCHQSKAESLNRRSFALGRLLLSAVPRLGGTLFAVCSRAGG